MPRYKKKHTRRKNIRKTKSSNRKLSLSPLGLNGNIGGGILNLAIREERDRSATLPLGLSKFNPASYFKSTRVNPNMFRVLYNYGSPYQIDLTLKQNQVLQSSNVMNKPHLFMPDMNHYLISLIEHPGKPTSRLIWLASYKNRSWEHDILSYMPPSPKPGRIHSYALLVYKYPLETGTEQIYKPIEMTTAKRKEEFRNFQIYLAANKIIQAIPGLSKYFKVQFDASNAMSFLADMLGSKTKSGSVKQNKMSVRQTTPRMEMKGMNGKMEKLEK
jgi:hypothetical protein